MKISPMITNQFQKDAIKRGYDEEQTQEYIQDRSKVYKEAAKVNNVIVGGTMAGLAGTIVANGLKLKKEGVKFFSALKTAAENQFKPMTDEIDNVIKNMKFDESIFKSFTNGLVEGFKLGIKNIVGFCKSIPKPIAVIAGPLLLLSTIKTLGENNKVDAKHDTIKYLKEQ